MNTRIIRYPVYYVQTHFRSHNILLRFFVWAKHRPSGMLQLMFRKHRNKKVCPSSHSVSDKIKLLGLQLSFCLHFPIHTSHCDKVRTSLSL